jgi:excisionase family DNA binding protein
VEPKPDFYTVAEAAAKLRVNIKTAYEGVAAGDIPSTRVRGCIRIPRAALDRMAVEGSPGRGETK